MQCEEMPRSTLSDTRERASVPDPAQPLRNGDLVRVLRTYEIRRITEIQEGTPRLYRACIPEPTPHVDARQRQTHILVDPCERYLAAELRLQ
jgi:hypothetical protein